jgi:hypothetical protein
LREVDPGEVVERGAEVEPGFVRAGFLRAAGGWKRGAGGRGSGGDSSEVGLDGDVTRGELSLIGVEELEVLLEHEDVFEVSTIT